MSAAVNPLSVGSNEVLLVDAGVTLYASRNPADYQVSGKQTCGTIASSETAGSVSDSSAGITAPAGVTDAAGNNTTSATASITKVSDLAIRFPAEKGEGAHGQAELEDPEAVAEKGPRRLALTCAEVRRCSEAQGGRVEGLFLTVPICHTDIPPQDSPAGESIPLWSSEMKV